MQEFTDYLTQQIEAGRKEARRLEAEGRIDDASFAKVKANIYEVCRTVTQALINRPGAGVDAIRARFEGFQTTWGNALEQAKQHDNANGIVVEETKLNALADVIARFPEAK